METGQPALIFFRFAHRAITAARACSLVRAFSGDLTLPPLLPVARVSTKLAGKGFLQCGQFKVSRLFFQGLSAFQ